MVDILLNWAHSRDWAAALNSVVPTRKRTAGEAACEVEEPSAASEPAEEPPKAAREPAMAGNQFAKATATQSAAAETSKKTAGGESAEAAHQPSTSAGLAAPAAQELAGDHAEGGPETDVPEGQTNGVRVGNGVGTSRTAEILANPDQGDQAATPVAVAKIDAAQSTADDVQPGDGEEHAAKRQRTAP